MKNWFLAIRPKTLIAAVAPITVATALVIAETGGVSLAMSLLALLSALFIQIATNLINDALDFQKGADTKERTGPKRVTQSGLISSKKVMVGGALCLLLAAACGLPLAIHGGWPIFTIGALSLLMAYAYTGGPCPLAYKGLGDLFVILFFGLLAVGGLYYLQTKTYTLAALIAGLQMGFLATVLIAINNLRDREQDKKVKKMTLAVRFGETFSRVEIASLLGLSFLLGLFWLYKGMLWAAVLPLIILPFAIQLLIGLFKSPPGPIYNQYLAKAALVQIIFSFQLSLGFILSTLLG